MKIPKYLVVASLLLAVSTTAMGITFTDPVTGNPTSYKGPIIFTLFDRAWGTDYSPAIAAGAPASTPIWEQPPSGWPNTPAQGAIGGKGYGIFYIDTIQKAQISPTTGNIIDIGPGNELWQNGDNNQELVGIFWNVSDIVWSHDAASGTQTIEAAGMNVAIWEQDSGAFAYGHSSNRGPNPWDFTGVGTGTNPNLWLTTQSSVNGLGTMAPGLTEYVATFNPQGGIGGNPSAAGSAQTYMSVADLTGATGGVIGKGSFNDYLDSNYFGNADLFLNMNTYLNNPFNAVQPVTVDDSTVSSSDHTGGIVVPEPITVMAVFLGISSLGGYVRKRTRV